MSTTRWKKERSIQRTSTTSIPSPSIMCMIRTALKNRSMRTLPSRRCYLGWKGTMPPCWLMDRPVLERRIPWRASSTTSTTLKEASSRGPSLRSSISLRTAQSKRHPSWSEPPIFRSTTRSSQTSCEPTERISRFVRIRRRESMSKACLSGLSGLLMRSSHC